MRFHLSNTSLTITHCGKPFDERDVRGICGIAKSTKDFTAIGRFGIGFKSVYAFTRRPEVHSGDEDFAIENFVWPTSAPSVHRAPDATVFVLPLDGDGNSRKAIAEGLRRLGARTLLFLRNIDEISWSVDGGRSGVYVRGPREAVGEFAHRVVLLGDEAGKADVEETWLQFSRAVQAPSGEAAGHVELAFSLLGDKKTGKWSIQSVLDAPLVVYFPTVLSTNLAFLVQGPYRTTPSRDNVPRGDSWNQRLVQETASLLVDAMRWMRDGGSLDVSTLRCLPLDRTRYGDGNLFSPLFHAVHSALLAEPFLPTSRGDYVVAQKSRLARTQELRGLLSPVQLAALLGHSEECFWLSGDITQDRTPDLRQYLMGELSVPEITPEMLLLRLEQSFLEAQSDEWVLALRP